jgi:hypothetical protein
MSFAIPKNLVESLYENNAAVIQFVNEEAKEAVLGLKDNVTIKVSLEKVTDFTNWKAGNTVYFHSSGKLSGFDAPAPGSAKPTKTRAAGTGSSYDRNEINN